MNELISHKKLLGKTVEKGRKTENCSAADRSWEAGSIPIKRMCYAVFDR